MNKKAASIIMMIFEIIAVLLIVSMSVGIAKHYSSSLLTYKTNTAEDIRLMVETLVGVPGDAIVEYPHNVELFSFILHSNSVEVFEENDPKFNWVTRGFFLPKDYEATGNVKNKEKVCLERKDKIITLKEC